MDFKSTHQQNIIIFGGSFDPPHIGHRKAVNALNHHVPDSFIFVLPNPESPINKNQFKKPRANFQDRLRMCELAFDCNFCRTSDIENTISPPHYTFHTLNKIRSILPDSKDLFFAIGHDQFAQLDKWYKAKELLALSNFIVLNRNKNDLELTAKLLLTKLKIRYDLSKEESSLDLHHLDKKKTKIILLKNFDYDLSSSTLRNSSMFDQKTDTAVKNYIAHNKLYKL